MSITESHPDSTKDWLDQRFRAVDEEGVYIAHQPIYGFRAGHSEPGLIGRYIRTHRIMQALSHLRADSLLDVGAAEGYKARLAGDMFSLRVEACDLSAEACRRCEELFDIPATPADIHKLPYADESFDVVLCSETIEHVSDARAAITELLRVAHRAVIITVPHESPRRVRRNQRRGGMHRHINQFDTGSFDEYRTSEGLVMTEPILSLASRVVGSFGVGMRKTPRSAKFVDTSRVGLHNAFVPLARRLFDSDRVARILERDRSLCERLPGYRAVISVIVKDRSAWSEDPLHEVSADRILNFAVPLHYPRA